jgi:hypothetical protein
MWKRTRLIFAVALGAYSFFAKSPPAAEISWITTGTGRLCLLLVAVLILQWDAIRDGAPALWNRARGRGLVNELQLCRRELIAAAEECREPETTQWMMEWNYNTAVHEVKRLLRLHAPEHLAYWRTNSPSWVAKRAAGAGFGRDDIAGELDFAVDQIDTIIAAIKKKRPTP